ncbi:MAG: hypothetical protein AAF289_13465, partial [Cyanobacteria bacterium P01_A01_bin.135]
MTHPLSDDVRELLAGYVLGDLDSAEAEQVQQLLQQRPALQQEIQGLKAALAVVPCGLDLAEPAPDLRAQILQQAESLPVVPVTPVEATADNSWGPRYTHHPVQVSPMRARPIASRLARWFRLERVAVAAASVVLVLGASTILRLNRQVAQLEAQLLQDLPASKLTIEPANSAIATLWPGIQALIQDHGRSLQRGADVAALRPADLAQPLDLNADELANLPALPYDQGLLLGGSNCQLGKTKGVRLSYQWRDSALPSSPDGPLMPITHPQQAGATAHTVSAYLLHASADEFPQLTEGSLALTQTDGTNALMWQ